MVIVASRPLRFISIESLLSTDRYTLIYHPDRPAVFILYSRLVFLPPRAFIYLTRWFIYSVNNPDSIEQINLFPLFLRFCVRIVFSTIFYHVSFMSHFCFFYRCNCACNKVFYFFSIKNNKSHKKHHWRIWIFTFIQSFFITCKLCIV